MTALAARILLMVDSSSQRRLRFPATCYHGEILRGPAQRGARIDDRDQRGRKAEDSGEDGTSEDRGQRTAANEDRR